MSIQFPTPGPGPHQSPDAVSPGLSRAQEARAQALEGKATFVVSATVTPRGLRAEPSHYRGALMVSPDAIVFITRGPKEIRFEHTERTAVVMRSRLRTDLMLGTGEAEVRIRIPAAARRKLRRTLRESGIKVVERAS